MLCALVCPYCKRVLRMSKQVREFVCWSETKTVKAHARECWTLCLEAREILALTLTATSPVDAVLADWPSYHEWEHARFEGMPSRNCFSNDTRNVAWEERVMDPPYMLVLVVANPGDQESVVSMQASVRAAQEESHRTSEFTVRVRRAIEKTDTVTRSSSFRA